MFIVSNSIEVRSPQVVLPPLAVGGSLDPYNDRQAQFLPGRPTLPIEDVFSEATRRMTPSQRCRRARRRSPSRTPEVEKLRQPIEFAESRKVRLITE